MLRNQNSERKKAIINLISRIQKNHTEIGDYISSIENNMGAHVELTNGTIFVPHIAIADIDYAFQKPDFISYIRDSFVPCNDFNYNSPKLPIWKKIYNKIKLNDIRVTKNIYSNNIR